MSGGHGEPVHRTQTILGQWVSKLISLGQIGLELHQSCASACEALPILGIWMYSLTNLGPMSVELDQSWGCHRNPDKLLQSYLRFTIKGMLTAAYPRLQLWQTGRAESLPKVPGEQVLHLPAPMRFSVLEPVGHALHDTGRPLRIKQLLRRLRRCKQVSFPGKLFGSKGPSNNEFQNWKMNNHRHVLRP